MPDRIPTSLSAVELEQLRAELQRAGTLTDAQAARIQELLLAAKTRERMAQDHLDTLDVRRPPWRTDGDA